VTSFKDLESVRCAACGQESQQFQLASTNSFGAPDLDTRPPEMMRSTIRAWVQECPHCRYAAPDISSEAPDGTADLVRSKGFQAIECRFQRHSRLLEQMGHYSDAGWVSLHAAWNADDDNDVETGRQCRARAVGLWKKGKQHGLNFMESMEQEFALVVDVLRRRGDFAEAKETCLAAFNDETLAPAIEDILRFQLTLISREDDSCHRMDELPKRPDGAERVRLT
jgi:hypothetical protein